MSFVSVLGKVAGIIVDVVTKIGPIVELVKTMLPGISGEIEKVEELVETAQEKADDMIDRNKPELLQIQEFFRDLMQLGAAGDYLIQEVLDTADDDVVTFDEVTAVKDRVITLANAVEAIVTSSSNATTAIETLKNA